MVHHDWPLPLDLHVTPRKRKPYSPTGRGGRRVKSTDELSPLAGVSAEHRREPVKKPRKKRVPKEARSPSWPSELVNYSISDSTASLHPAPHTGESITAAPGLVNQRHPANLTPSSSSQESTAAEAMLALSASHVPVDSTTRTRSLDSTYAHSPSSDGESIERSPSSAQAEGDIRLSRQSFSELYPPASTSSLVSECHRAVPSSHHPNSDRHEPSFPGAMLRSQERDTASPITEHPHGGFAAPQILHPGVVSKHKQYPNLPQLSRIPDANQVAAEGRRLSGGSAGHFPGVSHVVDDSRAQRFSPSPMASRQHASATPPPVVHDEKILSQSDSRFGPANPFWPVPPGQQLQQQQQLEVSQASVPTNFSLPYMTTGWPGAATPFRTPFLPGLSSFPRSSVLTALDLPSSISSSSPNSYRPVMPPYYFIAPQYQLAMAAATGMKPSFVNSPIPSSSPSSSLSSGTLPYTAVATSPNHPPSSHLSAFKSLQNVRSFTPPTLHPLSSTNREEKPALESPVQANKWIQAPAIIGSQFPAGTPLFNPSTFALNAAQAALVPQMNLIGGATAIPQAHLSPSANEQLQMRESPPISTRRVGRGRRGGGNSDAGSMSPNPEHLTVRSVDQSYQLHESLEAEYRRWSKSLQASIQDNTKHTNSSVTGLSQVVDGGRPTTAVLSYAGSPNKESNLMAVRGEEEAMIER